MKVLMINGSPRENGNIATAFKEMISVFEKEGVEVIHYQIGKKDIRGCIACGTCRQNGKCVFDDIVNELAVKFEEADGLVIGSPVYYGSANGTLMSALQRLFYSTHSAAPQPHRDTLLLNLSVLRPCRQWSLHPHLPRRTGSRPCLQKGYRLR